MKASQLTTAEQIVKIVDSETDTTIYVEMCRVYGASIALARFIVRGDVRTISAACGQDLAAALDALGTIAAHKVWERPGMDIFAMVTTDDEGSLTPDSTLTIGGIHTAPLIVGERDIKRYVGRPTGQSLAMISRVIIGMGLDVWADLSDGFEALTELRDDEGTLTGYGFIVRHRTA